MKRQVLVGLIAAALFAFAGASLAQGQAPAASTAPAKKEAKHEMSHKKMEHKKWEHEKWEHRKMEHKKWERKKATHKAMKKKSKAPEAKTHG